MDAGEGLQVDLSGQAIPQAAPARLIGSTVLKAGEVGG